MRLFVHYLPQFVGESELAASTVIVVDLLRASSTICQALKSGARCVVPLLEVDETLRRAERIGREQVILGGERGGQIIPGFDLGNSPPDYSPESVFGRQVLFTTTNGTRALHHARLAKEVLIGAALNRATVVEAVRGAEEVHILCAGTGGVVTREDILAAGAIANRLGEILSAQKPETNEWADAAEREWQELLAVARASGRSPSEQLALELRETPGGKNLLAVGYDDDLKFCSRLDALDVLPEFNPLSGEITLR